MLPTYRFLGLLVAGLVGCQQRMMPTTVPAGPTVRVYGQMSTTLDEGSRAARNFSVEFSRRLPDQTTERITDERMPATGRYAVQLAAGQLYRAKLTYGSCGVELQEFAVPAVGTKQFKKNFYSSRPDTISIDHSSCLTGRRRYR